MAGKGLRISVEGIGDLEKQLQAVPYHVRQKIERPALEEAAQVVLAAIQARTPRRTGAMANEITAQTNTVAGKTSVTIRPAYKRVRYTHIVDRGRKASEDNRGTPDLNFFHGGIDATADQALEIIVARVGDGLTAYWASQGGAS